jgi:hypothetical protein
MQSWWRDGGQRGARNRGGNRDGKIAGYSRGGGEGETKRRGTPAGHFDCFSVIRFFQSDAVLDCNPEIEFRVEW